MAGQLFNRGGRRLYLTGSERRAFLAATIQYPREVRTFCGVLTHTSCRISESLVLTVDGVDLEAGVLVFETLKQRRRGVYRAVPVPPALLEALDLVHGIREVQQTKGQQHRRRLWPWSRTTAWAWVRRVMQAAQLAGPQAMPKGCGRSQDSREPYSALDGPRTVIDDGQVPRRHQCGGEESRHAHVGATTGLTRCHSGLCLSGLSDCGPITGPQQRQSPAR